MTKSRPNNRTKSIIILSSLVLSLLIIGASLVWKNNQKPIEQQVIIDPSQPVSQSMLSESNGKDGNQCLVAIEGTVYKIEDSVLWKDGEHTPSNNLAYCGQDLTEVLKQSPHGKSKLEQLEKVGTLEK